MVAGNNNINKCVACKEKIASKASVCPNCGSSQSKYLRVLNTIISPTSLLISIISIGVSTAAYYNSSRMVIGNPIVEAQITEFRENKFSFFIYNLGNAPSVVKFVDLKISLQQQEGSHLLQVGFELEKPIILKAGDFSEVEVSYDSFLPRWTSWEVSDPAPSEKFSTSFLYGAAGFGNNLHCELSASFTRSGYYDFNSRSNTQTNGNCVDAMEWFAKNVGPLKAKY